MCVNLSLYKRTDTNFDLCKSILDGGLSDGAAVGVAFGVIISIMLIALITFMAYRERYRFYKWWNRSSEENVPVVFGNPLYADSNVQIGITETDLVPTPIDESEA